MNSCHRPVIMLAYSLATAFAMSGVALAGPPYQTDDPEPVEYRHYEIYIGAEGQDTPDGTEASAPFAEINFGPLPNVQIAASFPYSVSSLPGGPWLQGAGAIDFGIKYRFIQEDGSRPQVAFYPSMTLSSAHGLDADDTTPKLYLPMWAQKTTGSNTIFGGGGWNRNPGQSNLNYWSGGIALVHRFTDHMNAGVEIYGNTAQQMGEPGLAAVGVGLNDDYSEMHSVLGSFGTSFAGERSTHAYITYELRLGPR